MGQRSDPYEQGEDDLGITVSGLPGQLDEPDDLADEPADQASGGADEVVVYDLADWSDMERTTVSDRLNEAGIPHGWDGTSLAVAAADEAPVTNVLDIVEGEAAPTLDAERDQVAYDLTEWDDDLVDTLMDELLQADIAYGWDGDELYVYAEQEEAADAIVDRVAHPDELAVEPDDGPAGAELLGEIFVAADRLQHDAQDPDGIISLLESSQVVEGAEPPYGLGAPEWDHLRERVDELAELLQADEIDAGAVTASARDLRTAVRPYV